MYSQEEPFTYQLSLFKQVYPAYHLKRRFEAAAEFQKAKGKKDFRDRGVQEKKSKRSIHSQVQSPKESCKSNYSIKCQSKSPIKLVAETFGSGPAVYLTHTLLWQIHVCLPTVGASPNHSNDLLGQMSNGRGAGGQA